MPSSPQLTSTRKGKKTANKKSARTPATIRKPRKRTLVVESADEAEATAAPQLQEEQYDIAAEAPQMVPVTSPAAQAARENATPVASTDTPNSPTASCPPPPCPAPSPPCNAPAPLTPPQEAPTSADPPQASVTTPERPRAKIAG
jgi:hypothetical protein